jgi:rare lipoprotein A
MYAMTAAHKTLPIPAYARVTNLRNGRSVVVRINDRGPFVGDRIIDLSYTAAWKLDMLRTGTAPVEVRVLSPLADAPATLTAATAPAGATGRTGAPGKPATQVAAGAGVAPPAGAAPAAASPLPPIAATAGSAAAIAAASAPRTTLQAGAFFSEANARARVATLAAAGIGNASIRLIQAGSRRIWQVRVGPLDTALEVDDMLERLRLAGVSDARRSLD